MRAGFKVPTLRGEPDLSLDKQHAGMPPVQFPTAYARYLSPLQQFPDQIPGDRNAKIGRRGSNSLSRSPDNTLGQRCYPKPGSARRHYEGTSQPRNRHPDRDTDGHQGTGYSTSHGCRSGQCRFGTELSAFPGNRAQLPVIEPGRRQGGARGAGWKSIFPDLQPGPFRHPSRRKTRLPNFL